VVHFHAVKPAYATALLAGRTDEAPDPEYRRLFALSPDGYAAYLREFRALEAEAKAPA